jgi:hypothetical protein
MPQSESPLVLSSDHRIRLIKLPRSKRKVRKDTRKGCGNFLLEDASNKTLYLRSEVPWRECGRPRRCFAPDFM